MTTPPLELEAGNSVYRHVLGLWHARINALICAGVIAILAMPVWSYSVWDYRAHLIWMSSLAGVLLALGMVEGLSAPVKQTVWLRLGQRLLALLFFVAVTLLTVWHMRAFVEELWSRHWFQTPLESVGDAAQVIAIVIIAVGMMATFVRGPTILAHLRKAGHISQQATRDIAASAALISVFLVLLGFTLPVLAEDLTQAELVPVLTLVSIPPLVFCIVRAGLGCPWVLEFSGAWQPLTIRALETPPELQPKSIWLVFDQPLTTRADRQLINDIYRKVFAQHPRLTLLAPLGTTLVTEHVFLAERLGLLDALYPLTAAELRDWHTTLPPVERGYALLFRQLHPKAELLTQAVTTLRRADEQVVLVATRATNLEQWRDLLPESTRVLWIDSEAPSANLGYPTFRWNRKDQISELSAPRRPAGVATQYYESARQAQDAQDYVTAEHWYSKLLTLLQHQSNEQAAGVVLHQLGWIASQQQDFTQADRWYRRALEIGNRSGDDKLSAISYHQLGRIAQKQQEFQAAERWYLNSLAVETQLGNESGKAITYHQLGRVAQATHNFAAAESWYRQSLAIEEALGNRVGVAVTCTQLGRLMFAQKQLAEAKAAFERSLSIDEQLGNALRASDTHRLLGRIASEQGDAARAAEEFMLAFKLATEAGHDSTSLILQDMARSLRGIDTSTLTQLRERWTELGLGSSARFDAVLGAANQDEELRARTDA